MTKNHQNPQKNALDTDVFSKLSVDQWRYITARIENPSFSKRAAAEHIGISENTVYGWDKYVDEAYQLAVLNIHHAAMEQRKQALMKAIAVKVSGLDSPDETIRQKVATEIIESELGKAAQRTEITGANGGAIKTEDVTLDYESKLNLIAKKLDALGITGTRSASE